MVVWVVGGPRTFQIQDRNNYNTTTSAGFAKDVPVGWLRTPMPQPQLVALIPQTLDNSNRGFNCQTWVEVVLKRLSDTGYLLQEDYSKGIDGMADATMEE